MSPPIAGPAAAPIVVIGIGINCLQQRGHLRDPVRGDAALAQATSLEIESRFPVDRVRVARALLAALDKWFGADTPFHPGVVLDCWRTLSDDLGTRVTVAVDGHGVTGRILDIDPDAALLLQTDAGARLTLDAAMTTVLERHP